MSLNKIGVIGAGQMGTGIAEVCATAGFDVYFMDIAAERLEASLVLITENLERLVEKGKFSAEFAR